MTKTEWIARCAARYRQQAGLTDDQANEAAEACFDAEAIEVGFETSDTYPNRPEDCADEDMSCWTG